MLSQHWSTPKRLFPCRKALTSLLRSSAHRNLLFAIVSGFSEVTEACDSMCWKYRQKLLLQNGTMWCVNNLSDALMGQLKENKGNTGCWAMEYSDFYPSRVFLLSFFCFFWLFFFPLNVPPLLLTSPLSSTGPVPSPVFPPLLIRYLRFSVPII